jgi:hypothetical protein
VCGVRVRRSPALGHTLRTNYGSDLSVFLATCPSDGVPIKLANNRDGGQRMDGDLGRMQNSSRRHRRFQEAIRRIAHIQRSMSGLALANDWTSAIPFCTPTVWAVSRPGAVCLPQEI